MFDMLLPITKDLYFKDYNIYYYICSFNNILLISLQKFISKLIMIAACLIAVLGI